MAMEPKAKTRSHSMRRFLNRAMMGKLKKTRNRTPPITKNDFLSFKNDILNVINQKPQNIEVKPQVVASPPIVASTPVVIPSVVSQPVEVAPKVISGHDLLNKIFFNR